jgi:fatty acid-binding protein DegV
MSFCSRIKRIERKLERLLRDQYKREILVIRVSRLISSVRQHREVDS